LNVVNYFVVLADDAIDVDAVVVAAVAAGILVFLPLFHVKQFVVVVVVAVEVDIDGGVSQVK
jgi:hypothetical protein